MCLSSPLVFPFNRLPNELKVDVFVHDLDSYRKRFEDEARRRPMILGAVCEDWHKVVWSSPQLWCKISLDFERYDDNKEVFDLYMKNSKSLPLNAAIIFHHSRLEEAGMEFLNDMSCEEDLKKFHRISEGLEVSNMLREANRLKSLDIAFGSADGGESVANITDLIKSGLHMLESLRLSREHRSHVFNIDSDTFSNCPQLHELSIYHISLDPVALVSCTQVTKLELTFIPMESCLSAIAYLPNLTHVDVTPRGSAPRHFRFNDGSSVFVHNKLQSLKLDVDFQAASSFLLSFSFPSLSILQVKNWDDSPNNGVMLRAITMFFIVSKCPLKSLCIITKYILEDDIWLLLERVHTTLEILKLMPDRRLGPTEKSDILYGLLKRLRSPSYFPRIEKIFFEEECGQLDYAAISGHLMKRMKSWPSDEKIRPSLFKVIALVENIKHQFKSLTNDECVADDIANNIVRRFGVLKEKGMDVSLKVRAGSFTPNAIVKALEDGEETVNEEYYVATKPTKK